MNADEFNEWCPEGTDVVYTDDFGGMEETKTKSIAWDFLCGTTVVKLEGKSGSYDVSRITRI